MVTKILMVCLGNICRSPMAEAIFKEEFKKNNINIEIHSAGTASYHIGDQADIRTKNELLKHGIDISEKRGQMFIPSHFQYYDFIFAMDKSNYDDIIKQAITNQAITNQEKDKVEMVMNIVFPKKNIPVPDPYYGGESGFSDVYKMLKQAAIIFVEKYKK